MKLAGISFILHLIGILFWLGSSVLLPAAILPALRKLATASQITFLEVFKRRFLPFFLGGGLLVGLTGWYQTVTMAKELDLRAIYTKHIAILLLISVSLYFWFFLTYRLIRSLKTKKGKWNQYLLFSWIQAALSVLVLICTGWLTQ